MEELTYAVKLYANDAGTLSRASAAYANVLALYADPPSRGRAFQSMAPSTTSGSSGSCAWH